MNGMVAVLLVLAVVNPVRRRYELPSDRSQVAGGAGLALAVILVLGVSGRALLDALEITVPTFRVAVGLVVAVSALAELLRPLPDDGPVAPGGWGAVAPVFFPVLFRPEVGLIAVVVGADAGVGWLAIGTVLALLDPIWWAGRSRRPRPDRAFGAALSMGAIVLAVDLLVDGVFAL